MLDVKNNFRGMYRDLNCRACKVKDETQEHILSECLIIHTDNETKVTKENLFSKELKELRVTANKVTKIMDILCKD